MGSYEGIESWGEEFASLSINPCQFPKVLARLTPILLQGGKTPGFIKRCERIWNNTQGQKGKSKKYIIEVLGTDIYRWGLA